MLCGWRRTGAAIAAVAVLEGIALSLPPVADALIAPLEQEARAASIDAKSCCYGAIVVLGGGIIPAAPPHLLSPQLTDGADRIWRTARLFHAGAAPRIVASGGPPRVAGASQSEAQAIQAILIELGVPATAITLEENSENTIENIAFVRRLVGEEPVALVTSAYHMPRALRLAQAYGLRAAAFPADWHVGWQQRPPWLNWLPTLEAALTSQIALREYAARLLDWRENPHRADP